MSRTRPAAAVAPLAVVLLLVVAPGVRAQDGPFRDVTLRGEVGLDTSVGATFHAGEATWRVPVTIRARLAMDVSLGADGTLRAVLLPSLAAEPGANEPEVTHGLQEAYARLRLDAVDLSLGWERLPLAEMRRIRPVSVERLLPVGERRGPLGARATWYEGRWRLRAAALAPTGEDLVPDGVGAVVSVRREAPALTLEAHALWTTRPAVGATGSASLGDIVVYGEAWLLADPWAARGGIGATGYLGDWMWTAEAGWAPETGDLRAPGRPVLVVGGGRPFGTSTSLDVTARASWPRAATDPDRREATLDTAATLRHDLSDASIAIGPALRMGGGAVAGAVTVSVRGYF